MQNITEMLPPGPCPTGLYFSSNGGKKVFLDSSGLFVTERVFQWRTSPPHTVMSSAEDSPSAPSEEHPVSSDRDTQTDCMITRIISDATLLSSLRSALGVEGQTNASAPNSSSTDNEGLQAQSVQGNRPVEGTRKNSGQPARHVTLNIEKSTLGQPTRHVTEEPVEQPPRHATNMRNSGQPARHVTLNIEKSTLGQPTRHVTEEPVEQPPRHATNMNAESADYDYQGDFYQDCSASDRWFVDEQWPSEATLDFSNLSAGSGRFKPSTEVTQFVSKYSSQTLSREERTVVMRKYPRPDIPILKAPEVDSYATSFLKAKFPAQEDKRLKRIYGAVSDAMAPLVAYMQAVEESGMQDESDPALQAVKAAAVLVGNAAALINEERRDVVLTAMNPAMKSSRSELAKQANAQEGATLLGTAFADSLVKDADTQRSLGRAASSSRPRGNFFGRAPFFRGRARGQSYYRPYPRNFSYGRGHFSAGYQPRLQVQRGSWRGRGRVPQMPTPGDPQK